MRTTFKEFPPYVNEILNIYPFNDKIIQTIDTTLHSDLQLIDDQILAAQEHYVAATDAERKEFKKKIHDLKQQREHRKRQAYISFLQSKEPSLASIFSVLVKSKFDFSLLSLDQQQTLVNTLVKHKLEETIKNKVPEILSTTEEELTQFVNDLFDLTKMDLTIPTRHGPVPLTFTKKEFMSSARKELPSLQSLEELKNLPLNFVTQLNEVNAPFFEESVIFKSLYTIFHAKNGDFPINDAYQVKVKKNGKEVIGYLSSYSPIDERNLEQHKNGKELYLYSEPITAPNQERTLLTRDGKPDGTPVVIKDEEQKDCDIDVIDKKINLNGDAF